MKITDDMVPAMYSGDEKNPRCGPMVAQFAIYDLPNGETIQVTFSSPNNSKDEVQIISVFEYKTPECRIANSHVASKSSNTPTT